MNAAGTSSLAFEPDDLDEKQPRKRSRLRGQFDRVAFAAAGGGYFFWKTSLATETAVTALGQPA